MKKWVLIFLSIVMMLVLAVPVLAETGMAEDAQGAAHAMYTVEFTYDGHQYVMPGDSTVRLSEILDGVGLTGAVEAVAVSEASLFSTSNETGEWIVTARRAFSSTEWMKVTVNGVVYEITVTDGAGSIDYYLVGTMNSWRPDPAYKLTWTGGDEYLISGVELNEGDELKIKAPSVGEWGAWFPDTPYNYVVEYDGTYDVYFRPNCDGNEDWFGRCIFVNYVDIPVEVYPVNIDPEIKNGSIQLVGRTDNSFNTFTEGETIILGVEPATGYALESLTYTPAGGQPTDITEAKSFIMPACEVTVTATFESLPCAAVTIAENIIGGTVSLTGEIPLLVARPSPSTSLRR